MSDPSPDPRRPIEEVAARFASAWDRGERPRIEDDLPAAGDPRRDALLRRLLAIELERRGREGEPPDRGEYEGRFPADRAIVREAFDAARVPPGTTVPDPFPGEFRVLRLLGVGGCGEVWLAQDLNLPRLVALKTLRVGAPSRERAGMLEALRTDAEALARLRHPNIVQVYAWRQSRSAHFLVLQYVPGGSLAARLKAEGPLDWKLAARSIADVAEGLTKVHALGIVHRDIKPGNILWDPEADETLLTDFGIAALHPEGIGVAGTYPYMAPEAFDGRVAPSLDVYALVVTLFQLATGSRPFPGPQPADYLAQIAAGLPDPDPRCRGLPAPLERLLRDGLAPDPSRRPGLPAFLDGLRGALNRLLVDDLAAAPVGDAAPGDVGLSLRVGLLGDDGRVDFAAATPPDLGADRLARDPGQVPPAPDRVRLSTGDRIRIEVAADRDGYLAVFNVGPTGNLNLLHPEDPHNAPEVVAAHRVLSLPEVELVPPGGRERLFAVWSLRPLPLRPADLLGLAEREGGARSRPYCTTRDLKRVQSAVLSLAPGEWKAVALELDHRPDPGP